jgi:hypothetical protein
MPTMNGSLAPVGAALIPAIVIIGGWATIIWGIRRWQRRSGMRSLAPRLEKPSATGNPMTVIRGGARIGWLSATWPLVVLSFDEACAEIRCPMLHPIRISRDEVVRIVASRGASSLHFETVSGRLDHVRFGGRGAVAAMAERGWPVA